MPQCNAFTACRVLLLLLLLQQDSAAQPQRIDRYALVQRHNVVNTVFDSLSPLTVGNGRFAYTVDFTGLQSFPAVYAKSIPLGTQSEWGWHAFPNTHRYRRNEIQKTYWINGKAVDYAVQWQSPARKKEAADYFRQNLHRLQLGNLGLDIWRKNGQVATLAQVKPVQQTLNLWTGEIISLFAVEGEPVEVSTLVHQNRDMVAVRIRSPLLRQGRIKIRLRFPYPTGLPVDAGIWWGVPGKHVSFIKAQAAQEVQLMHVLDTAFYFVHLAWQQKAALLKPQQHYFQLSPAKDRDTFAFSCAFTRRLQNDTLPSQAATRQNNEACWRQFWTQGAAVDFTGSTDPRALELERRIVLSQYLTRIQCAGQYAPSETGLTCNSRYGRPPMNTFWWNAVPLALWNRLPLLQNMLSWYPTLAATARATAKRQGYAGVRWQQLPDVEGNEAPSFTGTFMIWQQPHFIYLAELCYRQHPDGATLQQYRDLVEATATFMASYARFDPATARYVLAQPLLPAQGKLDMDHTVNPVFELAYWRWALLTAQQWRERAGMQRNSQWDSVLAHLAAFPVQEGRYLPAESVPNSYTGEQYVTGNPALLGAWGMLPRLSMLDSLTLRHTFNWIWYNWHWEETDGCAFPLVAMTATRLGMPERAVEALFMPFDANTYLQNGHNYQNKQLRLFLPGNGALLTAVAMMCAGYDGCTVPEPGFPKNGQWKLRWEGLQRMP